MGNMRDYISKINDRNLQRKRESGFTTYAIYGVMILICFKLTEIYSAIPFDKQLSEIIIIITYAVNIFISLYLIYGVYSNTLGHFSSVRIISKSNDKLLENIIEIIIILIPLILNSFAFFHFYIIHQNFSWYFFTVSLVIIVILFFAIFLYFKEKNKTDMYEIFKGTSNDETDKDIFSVICYTLLIIFGSTSTYFILNDDSILNKRQVFLFAILTYGILFLIYEIMDLKKRDIFSVALENLEYEINVRNFSDEQIRERLQKNFMGFLLPEWINYNLKEFDQFKSDIIIEKNLLQIKKESMEKIDANQYPIEYNGRESEIKELEHIVLCKLDNFLLKKINEIKNIFSETQLQLSERNDLLNFARKIQSDIIELKK